MGIRVIGPRDGERLRAGPIDARVMEDGGHTGGTLGVTELTIPPGQDGPPQHIHHRHAELFWVLEGPVQFTSGEATLMVDAGHLVLAPVGVPHTFGNPRTDRPVRLLFLAAPRPYVGYFRTLDRMRLAGQLTAADVAGAMREYDTEVWSSPPDHQ